MYSNYSYSIKVLLPCDPLCGEKNTKSKLIPTNGSELLHSEKKVD